MDKKISLKWPTEASAMSNTDWMLLHFLKRIEYKQVGNIVTFSVPKLIDYNKVKRLASQCGAEVIETVPVMDVKRWVEISQKLNDLKDDTPAIRRWMIENTSKEEMFDFFWQWVYTLQR